MKLLIGVVLVMAALAVSASAALRPDDATDRTTIRLQAEPFDLADVQLLDGPFRHARELDRQYLRSLDPERLLYNFRVTAGLPTSAKPLGGWESPDSEVRGHFVGHYLSACAEMVRSTGDPLLKANADRMVAGMAECQAKIGTGYLSAYPEEEIDRVIEGRQVWAPWYTIHKIYAGLLDMYQLTGNRQALEVLEKAAGWVKKRLDPLTDAQVQRMLEVEQGGMNEVLANLYALTGNKEYLALSIRFNHHRVIDPLARREDPLTGLHANTQFPKIIGVARQYELTGDPRDRTIATYFWDVVTKERSYVTGGNSDGEYFSPKEELSRHIGPATTETCNTYNMLKLTRHLFEWEPRAEYADFYERGLLNHILASQNPETGMMCYYVPLKTGTAKGRLNPFGFSRPLDSFWCCTGTGVENHAKYGDSIYFHRGKEALYVNLFIASELRWREAGVTLRQETRFPEEAATRLVLTCEKRARFTLNLRHPYWATSGFTVRVNGQAQDTASAPQSYVSIDRTWRSGDTVEIEMPMSLRTEAFHDNPKRLALMYGPLVLCSDTAPADPLSVAIAAPARVTDRVKPLPGQPLRFTAPGAEFRTSFGAAQGSVTFLPFYQEYRDPYAVYWDAITPAEWAAREEEHRKELAHEAALAARTIDRVEFVPRSEQEHHLQGEHTGAGEFDGRHWRHATDGGWFSFELKVLPDRPATLLCTFWGSDVGGRDFDVLVDGTKIASVVLQNNRPGRFFDEEYPLPAALTHGKERVTVRFQAHPGRLAGGCFGCWTLR